MLIRSQDNKKIINLDNVESISVSTLDGSAVIWCGSRLIGEYSTEERAIKVLDMFERRYLDFCCNYHSKSGVFQMPADDEVEDD